MNQEPIIATCILIPIILIIILISKSRSKAKKKCIASGLIHELYVNHVNGLPIAEDVGCFIKYYKDKIEITASGTEYNISMDRITDICVKTESEIQQQYVSSAGGAVAGALMFGAVGAIIGGRAKKKKTTKISYFLIITYMKNEEVKYIGFDVSNNYFAANKIVSDFKANHSSKTPQKIDL